MQSEFIAISRTMLAVRDRIQRVAPLEASVLITGESGTGKEVVARQIFALGNRCGRSFVPVNCGALPETLVESELFGHRKGAFTNAESDRRGLVEEAEGGVLFLDEIGEMPLSIQPRLLRFLDSGEFRRLGDSGVRRARVRVIAATNRPLEHDVATGRFRQDLYHRLNVIPVMVPPLRERKEDVAALARYCLCRTSARLHRTVTGFEEQALRALENYGWPGNVRELQNVVESAVAFAAGATITAEDVLPRLVHSRLATITPLAQGHREDMHAVLELFGGNHSRAARALGINRTTLWRQQRRLRQSSPPPSPSDL